VGYVLLLVGIVSVTPSVADEAKDAELAKTVMQGLLHRYELIKSIECVTTYTGFNNPILANPNFKFPLMIAGLSSTLGHPAQDRWVCESRRIILNDTLTRDDVFARDGKVTGYKSIHLKPLDARPWLIEAQSQTLDSLLYNDTLVLTAWTDTDLQQKNVSIREEVLDGARCFRVVLRPRQDTSPRADHYLWIDPAMGYALRKWCIAGVTNGKVGWGSFRHGYDFHEYAPGVWLPRRTQLITMKLSPEDGKLQWDRQRTYKVLQMKVNQPVPEDLFLSLVFKGEIPMNPYETRLGDKTEIVCENSPQAGMTEKIAVDLLLSRLYEQISKAPDDMSGFVEALPQ
jgi:hypothetical protein